MRSAWIRDAFLDWTLFWKRVICLELRSMPGFGRFGLQCYLWIYFLCCHDRFCLFWMHLPSLRDIVEIEVSWISWSSVLRFWRSSHLCLSLAWPPGAMRVKFVWAAGIGFCLNSIKPSEMDILSSRSNTKQDEEKYRHWFDYADAGLPSLIILRHCWPWVDVLFFIRPWGNISGCCCRAFSVL